MKTNKLLFATLSLFAILILHTSCKKNNPVINQEYHPATTTDMVSRTDYGFLKISNRDAFDKLCTELNQYSDKQLNEWEEKLNFFSFRTEALNNRTPSNKNSALKDDLFKTFIDKNGMIQIGDVIYKVSADENIVWTLNASSGKEGVNNLLAEKFAPNSMNRFRCNDNIDIYEAVGNGMTGHNVEPERGLFGSDVKIDDYEMIREIEYDPKTGEQITTDIYYLAQCKTSYQNTGIYKSVMAEMKYMKRKGTGGLWDPLSTSITMYANWKFKPKKKSEISNSNFTQTVIDNKNNIRPYSGTRQCDGYINASFVFTGQSSTSPTRSVYVPKNNF